MIEACISTKALFKTWALIALGFVFFRLMAQIDLVMLSPFGQDYIAGFGVPSKIMLLDLLVAFSLGPVASIFLAQAKTKKDQASHAGQIIVISALIAFAVTIIAIVVYPQILLLILKDQNILSVASMILFWSTISIPFRLLHFVQAMIHHGMGLGKVVLYIDAFALTINVPLNFVLIKFFGASGIFISTFIISFLSSVLFFASLHLKIGLNFSHLSYFRWRLIRNFLTHAKDEFMRLIFHFGHGFIIISVLGYIATSTPHILAAFCASSEGGQLIMMLFIAVMRSIAIISAPLNNSLSELVHLFKNAFYKFLALSIVLSVLIASSANYLGLWLYNLPANTMVWWNAYILLLAISLPWVCLNSFLRGFLQSKKQFSFMTRVEIFSKWTLSLPIFLIGIKLNSPYLAWSCLIIAEVCDCMVYCLQVKKLA